MRVGDNLIDVAPRFGHPSDFDTQGDATVLAWDRNDGVRLSMSVMPESRRIVSVELSSGGKAPPVLGGLALGKTTLADIRTRFGSDGFSFAGNARIARDGQVVSVRCYGVAGSEGVVLCVIAAGDDGAAVLRGVILADGGFLKKVWGAEGSVGAGYKAVELGK